MSPLAKTVVRCLVIVAAVLAGLTTWFIGTQLDPGPHGFGTWTMSFVLSFFAYMMSVFALTVFVIWLFDRRRSSAGLNGKERSCG